MNLDLATDILGLGRTLEELRLMIRALEFHRWNNSQDEMNRLAAARYVVRRFEAYRNKCNMLRGVEVARLYRQRYLQ